MKVKINQATINRIINLNNKINELQKNVQTIIEVYSNALGMVGELKLNTETWELKDSRPEEIKNDDIRNDINI